MRTPDPAIIRGNLVPSQLSPGIRLPPVTPGGQSHVVTDPVVYDADRPDYMVVKTNWGEWSFHHAEVVSFPRRDRYGTKIDWYKQGIHPHGYELCIGDIVAPGRPDTETQRLLKMLGHNKLEDLPPGDVRDSYLDQHRQQALRVWSISQFLNGPFWEVTLQYAYLAGGAMRRFKINPQLRFNPMDHTPPMDPEKPARTTGGLEYRTYGPYVDKETGRKYVFAEHPFGRGRWASGWDVPVIGGPNDGIIHVTRPPKHRGAFAAFEFAPELAPPEDKLTGDLFLFQRGRRHPKDPLFWDGSSA